MDKYKRGTKNNIKNISLDSSRKEIVKLTVKSIKLSNITSKNIKSIETADEDIEHPPTVTVTFDTGYVEVQQDFRIDPFILPPFEDEVDKLLGNLLSLADIQWDSINDIIGKKVKFYNNELKPIKNKRNPSNPEYLIDYKKQNLYTDNIDSLFIDIVYNHVHNRKLGYAVVNNINTVNNYIEIEFELAHNGKFTQILPLDKNIGESLTRKFKNKFSYKRNNLFDNTVGPKQNNFYTYWDFCKESIGYIPNKEEYSEIIGKEIDVTYTVTGWRIKNSMKNIHY